jgi:hypothetical protein
LGLVAFPAAQRTEPAATVVTTENLVLGVAASFDGGGWAPRNFGGFLKRLRDGAPRPPLRLDHVAHRYAYGRQYGDTGRTLGFAVTQPIGGVPGGLLVIGELHPDLASSVLAGMRNNGQWMGISIRGSYSHWDDDPACGDLWVTEVSLTRDGQQEDPGAVVLGIGRDAASLWQLLTTAACRSPDRPTRDRT